MKKLFFLILYSPFILVFLCSCAEQVRSQEYICYHLGFDRIGGAFTLSVTLSEIGGEGQQEKETLFFRSVNEKDVSRAFQALRGDFPNLYYKNVELMFFGGALTARDHIEIIRTVMNDSELPLKCKAVLVKGGTAYARVKQIDSQDKSDSVYQDADKARFIEYAANTVAARGIAG